VDRSNRRVVISTADFGFPVANAEVRLANVAVVKLAGLEVDQNEAPENDVVKNEAHAKVVAVDRHSLLATSEDEAAAKSKQKLVELIDQRLFELALA
jgi:hypothetical protein